MAQMQPLSERPGEVRAAAEEAYASLVTYNLEIKQAEEALAVQNHETAFSHLLLAVNCASNILNWRAVPKAISGFATQITEMKISSIMQGIGASGPPYDRDMIIQLEEWLKSSWVAKFTEIVGRVAAGLGAESYGIQAGFPGGVSITVVFPAAKSESAAKQATKVRTGASVKGRKRR